MQTVESMGYLGIFLVMLLETALPVLPSEVTLPFIGFLTTRDTITLFWAIVASTVGALAGALVLYWLSLTLGIEVLTKVTRRYGAVIHVKEKDIARAQDVFLKKGAWAVFLCRMLPVLRCLISVPAGLARMPLVLFAVCTLIGSLLWNGALIWCGKLLGNHWEDVAENVDKYGLPIVLFLVLAVVVAIVIRMRGSKGLRR